jgi:hypothetical protein
MPTNITNTKAWFPDDAVIKLQNKTTGSITNITTKVTNFSDGGGDKETESIAHFGGAFIVIRKPQADYNVEFDVSVNDTTWSEIINGDVVGSGPFRMVRSGGTAAPHKVKIQWNDPDSQESYKILYYNAYGVTFEQDNAADDRLTGTLSFNIAPTDSNGSPQRIEMEVGSRNSAVFGSTASGLYGSYETIYDTMYGYGVGSML